MRSPSSARSPRLGLASLLIVGLGVWADRSWGWAGPVFVTIAHLFYEIPILGAIRQASQLELFRFHLTVLGLLASLGLIVSPWLDDQGRKFWSIFLVGYAIRAACWITGGNIPLIPGDSCHYLEVARSVARGEGPVKHYVESYFLDYPEIRQGRGILDDWATPLWAYVLGWTYRLAGIVPGGSNLERADAIAKGLSFTASLLGLPALYGFARRRDTPETAILATALLAVLPVHAIYAGFELRESAVALTSILAVWATVESWSATMPRNLAIAALAGWLGGLAILGRNTALALMGATALFGLARHRSRAIPPLIVWGIVLGLTIAPWAYATWIRYGEPFYTYTKFFQYNFSWTVHHYMKGNTRASEFYTPANLPAILRIKFKTVVIILSYCLAIPTVPLVLGFFAGLRRPGRDRRITEAGSLSAWLFVAFGLATLANIADVTQVLQLGRYYLPLFVLMLPTAAAGLLALADRWSLPGGGRILGLVVIVASLWGSAGWAYDTTWYWSPYQLHWPALRDAAAWVEANPKLVAGDARVLTWFPWEFRVASDRTTVLFPRSYFKGHVERAIRDYQVTHVLWGSFELPEHEEPAKLERMLEDLRGSLGLGDSREIYRSPPGMPYPVRLYRLGGLNR